MLFKKVRAQAVFQHAAARRRLGPLYLDGIPEVDVSTRSRPKAAGKAKKTETAEVKGFNTQPPEGGWIQPMAFFIPFSTFQHAAARRRLVTICSWIYFL